MATDPIFEPLQMRGFTVKNRIFRSSISGRFDNVSLVLRGDVVFKDDFD